jgi:iron complex outermembrane receptor protein
VGGLTDEVTVDAQLDPFKVMPTRATDSLFGIDKPIAEIPRSISLIEADHIARYDVRTVNDLVTVAPGSFTGSYFGVPGSLFVRGEPGDNFFRGFRRVENRGNYATPVAATDHIEIVKGPPSPIYGGGKIGGFLNFQPKTARSASAKWMEHPQGKGTVTYGSYDQRILSGEVGVPFTVNGHRAGFYAFGQYENSNSFYRGIYSKSALGQIAFDMELAPGWRTEFGLQGYNAKRPQNIGWNRVTQDLIDKKQYLAGVPLVNLSHNGNDLTLVDLKGGALEQFAFQQNMGVLFKFVPDFATQASLFKLDPATVHTVTLSHRDIFVDSPDFSDATTYTAYFDVIRDVRPGLTIKNQTFYDSMDHQKFSTYGFGADYQPWVIENKTSIDWTTKFNPSVTMKSAAGFAYRYSGVSAGESRGRGYQVIDRRDISRGALPNDRFQGPFNSGGQIGFNYFQDGSYGDSGAFMLSSVDVKKLNVIGGIRVDHYTPDFTGRFNGEPNQHATSSDTAATYNASASVAAGKGFHPYFTWATSTYLELGQGSELDQSMVAAGTYLQDSNLYEGGVKYSGVQGRAFASASLFRQKRTAVNKESGDIDYFRTTGLEVEARAAISRKVSFTAAYTWQKPEQLNVPFLLGIPPSLLGLSPQDGYAGRFVGLASIFNIQAPVRVPGQPANVGSIFGTYSFRRDAGVTLGTTAVSAVNAGYVSGVRLPGYAVWRASTYWRRSDWTLNLAINNVFNKEYYQSQFLFWDVFIKPSELRTASLTLTYGF